MNSPDLPKGLALIVLLAALLGTSSCSWLGGGGLDAKLGDKENVSATYSQIRLRMRSLVDPMSGQLEQGADRILERHDEPSIQRAALEWKSQGVPALREALYQPNALTAVFDTWVLLYQMEEFYATGDGAGRLGAAAPIAVETCRAMEAEYHQVIADMTQTGELPKAREGVRRWAREHPIEGSISYRESTLTRALEVELGDELSATDAIADITLTVDDLNRRLEIYSDQAVRQARWEAQLLTMDLSEQLGADQAMPLAQEGVAQVAQLGASVAEVADSIERVAAQVEALVPIVNRLAATVEEGPELIASERAVAIQAAQDEISRTIEFVQQEREIALKHISTERHTALLHLHETIAAERKVLTEDLEAVAARTVDHTFKRVVQLVAALVLVLALLALAGLFIVRRMIAGFLPREAG